MADPARRGRVWRHGGSRMFVELTYAGFSDRLDIRVGERPTASVLYGGRRGDLRRELGAD